MFKYFIGIDPGVTGAIAVLTKNKIEAVFDYPRDNPRKLLEIYRSINTPDTVAVMEQIISLPGAHRQELYKSFFWQDFCMNHTGIEYTTVYPNTWKKEFSLTKSKGKDDAYNLCFQIFDEAGEYLKTKTNHHNRAEALLLADFCRRMN